MKTAIVIAIILILITTSTAEGFLKGTVGLKETDKTVFGDPSVDREGQSVGYKGGKQGGVEERGVIGDDENLVSRCMVMLQPFYLDPKEQIEKPGDQALGKRTG